METAAAAKLSFDNIAGLKRDLARCKTLEKFARREADRKQAKLKADRESQALRNRSKQQAAKDVAVRLAGIEWGQEHMSDFRKLAEEAAGLGPCDEADAAEAGSNKRKQVSFTEPVPELAAGPAPRGRRLRPQPRPQKGRTQGQLACPRTEPRSVHGPPNQTGRANRARQRVSVRMSSAFRL